MTNAMLAAISLPSITPWLLLGVGAVLVVLMITIANRADKKRRVALVADLQSRGWSGSAEPDDSAKAEAFSRIARVPHLPDGPKGVRWHARGPLAGHLAQIVEYTYSTGSGKSRTTHYVTLLSVDAPASWPSFTLQAESIFHRLGEKLGLKADLKLENEAFNKRWRLRAESDDAALAILSPEVQTFLEKADLSEWWSFGRGTIALIHTRQIKPPQLAELTARLESLVSLLDPALRESLPRAGR